MRLWILKRIPDRDRYDVLLDLVVRAPSEEAARTLAQRQAGDDDYHDDLWLNPKKSSCAVLSARGKSEVIITDFKAG